MFREQADALAAAGVDLFMLETFGDVAELGAAVRGVRAVSDLPVVAQLTTGDDGATADGTPPEQFTAELEALGADVIGLNCSVGPAAMLETLERIAERTTARLSVQPNAGRPRDVEGRNIYLCSPEYMASYARRFVGAGVRLVGGCCGTTRSTPARCASRPRRPRPGTGRPGPRDGARGAAARAGRHARAAGRKSRLASALSRGQFVLARGAGIRRADTHPGVRRVGPAAADPRVDALLVTDRPASRARMVPLAAALLWNGRRASKRCCSSAAASAGWRMQAELLGAHALGLRNILVVTGEPARRADYTDRRCSSKRTRSASPTPSPGSITAPIWAASDRRADVVPHRHPRQPVVARSRRGSAPLSLQGRRRRRVRHDRAGIRRRRRDPLPQPGRGHRPALIVTIRTLGTLREAERLANEVPASGCRTVSSNGCVGGRIRARGRGGRRRDHCRSCRSPPLRPGIVVSGARPDLVFP